MTSSQATQKGILYIVATPIGNLEDITQRAIHVLRSVDCILAEDTRHSAQLLNALGIKNKLQSLHAHNEHEKSNDIISGLSNGLSYALISDAGTPLISDPGYPLVAKARAQGIQVSPVPGACALIAALSAAGIPCDSFLFLGFLPAKKQARCNKLEELKSAAHTLICYESTHRITECIEDMITVLGADREIALAKEITKSYEHFLVAPVAQIQQWFLEDASRSKGEFVLMIPPVAALTAVDDSDALLQVLMEELPLKQAVSLASKITGKNRNTLYDRALQLKKGD